MCWCHSRWLVFSPPIRLAAAAVVSQHDAQCLVSANQLDSSLLSALSISLSVCCWLTDHRSSFCFLLFVFFFPLPLLFGSLFLSVLPSTFELRLGAPFWLFLPVFCRYFCFGLLTVFSAVSTLAATAVAVVSGFVLLFASALFLVVQFSPSFSLPFSPSFVHLAACYLFSNSLLLLLLQVCLLACFASIIIIISHSLFCVIIGRRKLCFCLLAKLTKGCSSIRRAA